MEEMLNTGETVVSTIIEYSEQLEQIHKLLFQMYQASFFTTGILVGCVLGAIILYFIGNLMQTR